MADGKRQRTMPTASAVTPLTLRTGAQMPAIGLGCWKIPKDATGDVVVKAIELGYRHLDCASDYGNEAEVGAGIARAIAQGLVTRDELWVTSKLWNTYHAEEHIDGCPNSNKKKKQDFMNQAHIHGTKKPTVPSGSTKGCNYSAAASPHSLGLRIAAHLCSSLLQMPTPCWQQPAD